MSRSDSCNGQNTPRRWNNWPDRTVLQRGSLLLYRQDHPEFACYAPADRQSCGPRLPRKLIGTYLASALTFSAQCRAPARGGFMQTDPILFVRLLRQCNATADSAEQLLHWLKQASLLCCQSHGHAVSTPLVQGLIAEFGPILQTLATLDGDPAHQAACQQLFSQVCLFYRELNSYCDQAPQQQWRRADANCAAKHGHAETDTGSAGPTKCSASDSAQNYNRYD
ncbi:hypothetical protein [Rheinheimera sp. F8]|uniref:hypothetical protein n=1 Tax=Rheinheimera sp. F8 TaxID=1763998 RepID=UPI000744B42F|nr:hypothetical protein [Rheinheimera sp. F8]ALZ74585.1 hypothetical protein ATY27_01630 [Rheinheimera sp. F8]